MRQQLPNFTRSLCWQSRENVLQIGIWIMPIHARRLDQAHDRRRALTAAQRPGKQPVRATKCPRPYLIVG